MCEVTTATLAYASIAASVAGAGISMYGQYQAGQAAKAQGAYQAAVLRNNQIIAGRAAEDARLRGEEASKRKAMETKQLIGRQRAALAGNGVVVDQDSALEITGDTAEMGKWDELTIRSNAEREALGYEAQGMNAGAEAGLALARGQSASSAATLGMAGTFLTGAGTVAGRWYDFQHLGAFGSTSPASTWRNPDTLNFASTGGYLDSR